MTAPKVILKYFRKCSTIHISHICLLSRLLCGKKHPLRARCHQCKHRSPPPGTWLPLLPRLPLSSFIETCIPSTTFSFGGEVFRRRCWYNLFAIYLPSICEAEIIFILFYFFEELKGFNNAFCLRTFNVQQLLSQKFQNFWETSLFRATIVPSSTLPRSELGTPLLAERFWTNFSPTVPSNVTQGFNSPYISWVTLLRTQKSYCLKLKQCLKQRNSG